MMHVLINSISLQYPKGLGNTVSEIDMTDVTAYPKTMFSMVIPEVEEKLKELSDVKSIVLFGIEVSNI